MYDGGITQLFNDLGRVFMDHKWLAFQLLKTDSLYFITLYLTAVRVDSMCLERMVVEQWLEFVMKRDL